ncbi:P-loop NTPase [Paenactinomyces guangxiensis]|uniref:P-loop NTPase n=1 Tax=Paenactinomyces guangxiensis TaxID=1490290 RepID=A0A7W1WP38_9BACL|nr:P-loop NTPase [Paenactinomyces guangxiensis]MBA4493464.1 P-loop NTPase [Paenactinomyces guangxiensis]MBH8590555.1 P-loop NTPase [Paenactinomyces guangxiensis]
MLSESTKVIYIYSGKGGVGKSTVAVNLAYAFQTYYNNLRVGLFDADFQGPSIPTMLNGIEVQKKIHMKKNTIQPAIIGEITVSSPGYIDGYQNGNYFFGKYIEGALHQLLYKPDWDCDVLIVDLPPGSGELHKQLLSQVKGKVVLVTTPERISYADTQKGIDMLRRLEIPILGVIENMSYIGCFNCGTNIHLYQGDVENEFAQPNQLPLLNSIPILPEISTGNNKGIPFILEAPEHPISMKFKVLASELLTSFTSKRFQDH